MALQLNDATAIINRTTNLVAANSDFCCGFWWKPTFVATSPAYIAPWAISNAGYTDWVGIFGNDAGLAGFNFFVLDADGTVTSGGPDSDTNVAVHFAYRRSGNDHFLYINGTLIDDVTKNVSAFTFTEMLLGNDRVGIVSSPFQIWDYFEYSDDKSVTTIRNQMASYGTLVDATNIRAFTPLATTLNDTSGQANHWSGAGNYSFVSNPSLPTNLSAATATVISSLPYSLSLTDTYNLSLFWTYTTVGGENEIGAFAYGTSSGFKPLIDVLKATDLNYHWPDGSTTIGSANLAIQFPVISGDSYVLNVLPSTRGTPAPLELSVITGPQDAAVQGSFFINDDRPYFPAAILDRTDGTVLQFGNPNLPTGYTEPIFPAGEGGENLSRGNGRICLIDDFELSTGDQIYLYEPDLSMVDVIAPTGLHNVQDVTSDSGLTRFYLLFRPSASNLYMREMSDAGVISGTSIGTLASTEVGATVVNDARTILYYVGYSNTTNAKIYRWDLGTNLALSDLAANPGAYKRGNADLIGCPDGGVIFSWLNSAETDYFVRKYNADGTTAWSTSLNTYLPKANVIDRMTLDYDPAYLWYFYHQEGGFSTFIQIRVSDGAIITDIEDVVEYETGVYQPAETATPLARFGHSFSCPFLVLTAEDIEPPASGSANTIACPHGSYHRILSGSASSRNVRGRGQYHRTIPLSGSF